MLKWGDLDDSYNVVSCFSDFITQARRHKEPLILVYAKREKRSVSEQIWGKVKGSLSPLPLSVLQFTSSNEDLFFEEKVLSRKALSRDGTAKLVALAVSRIEKLRMEIPESEIIFIAGGRIIEYVNLRCIDYELNRSHGA